MSIKDEPEPRPDGSKFKKVSLRSTVGTGTYTFPEAPTIAPTAFDPLVRDCIHAGPKLTTMLAKRYSELAHATLSDLTEEERRAVTEPSDFGPGAFAEDEK